MRAGSAPTIASLASSSAPLLVQPSLSFHSTVWSPHSFLSHSFISFILFLFIFFSTSFIHLLSHTLLLPSPPHFPLLILSPSFILFFFILSSTSFNHLLTHSLILHSAPHSSSSHSFTLIILFSFILFLPHSFTSSLVTHSLFSFIQDSSFTDLSFTVHTFTPHSPLVLPHSYTHFSFTSHTIPVHPPLIHLRIVHLSDTSCSSNTLAVVFVALIVARIRKSRKRCVRWWRHRPTSTISFVATTIVTAYFIATVLSLPPSLLPPCGRCSFVRSLVHLSFELALPPRSRLRHPPTRRRSSLRD